MTAEETVFSELNDLERIKQNSQKYANVEISEAFADYYGLKFSNTLFVEEPIRVSLNDIVTARIVGITEKEVLLESPFVKGRLSAKINTSKAANLATRIGTNVDVKIVAKSRDGYTVDMLAPAFDYWANNIKGKAIEVRDLKLLVGRSGSGGYSGKIYIDELSEQTGVDTYVDAFIPGSQIVLNIERDFNRWVGKDVKAFVDVVSTKPNSNELSVICSVKKYLKYIGEQNLVEMYKAMLDNGKEWKEMKKTVYKGTVTGVINSSKRVGVFVEIEDAHITTLIPTDASELVKYKPGQSVEVMLEEINSTTYYDSTMNQTKHNIPYEVDPETGEYINVKLEPTYKLV